MRRSTVATITFLGAFIVATSAFAQIRHEDRDVLRGLEQVYVVVERLKPEIEREGLYGSTLQSDAEMKLKMAGMRVLEQEETAQTDTPFLLLQVNARKFSGGYIYDTRVFLREPVVLLRKQMQIDGTTVRVRGQFGFTPHLSDIREEARDAMDEFIKAWQEANSKTP